MKTAYSVLLGEYVDAATKVHKDCEFFQIVCPACKEQVYKVERPQSSELLHFFSHYREQDSFASDCELRVSRLTASEMDRSNAVSRGQKLRLFLAVLREALVKLLDWKPPELTAQAYIERLHKNRAGRSLMRPVYPGFVDVMVKHLDQAADEVQAKYGFLPTTFSHTVQRRIARDFLLHLASPAASGNFFYLIDSCLFHLWASWSVSRQRGDLQGLGLELAPWLHSLCLAQSREEADAVIRRVRPATLAGLAEPGLYLRLLRHLGVTSTAFLLQLPYFEILREQLERRAAHAAKLGTPPNLGAEI